MGSCSWPFLLWGGWFWEEAGRPSPYWAPARSPQQLLPPGGPHNTAPHICTASGELERWSTHYAGQKHTMIHVASYSFELLSVKTSFPHIYIVFLTSFDSVLDIPDPKLGESKLWWQTAHNRSHYFIIYSIGHNQNCRHQVWKIKYTLNVSLGIRKVMNDWNSKESRCCNEVQTLMHFRCCDRT